MKPSLANMIDSKVKVFSKVDVDKAMVGKKRYGLRRYLYRICQPYGLN